MTDKAKSAELIMKLYDLRREPVMREARNWFFTFNPESIEDIQRAAMGEHSAYFRMVTTYWDMACSFVNHGAIDADMQNLSLQGKVERSTVNARIGAGGAPIHVTGVNGSVHLLPRS